VVVQFGETVAIVAVDGDELLLVRQPRAGAVEQVVEVPAGKIEPGESPREAAERELAEECGVRASRWTELGAFYAAAAYSTEYVHAFAAEDIGEAGPAELEVLRLPLPEALERVNDASSLAALALWSVKSRSC
jgi:ADP-ribose pyrophosphatase